MTNAIVFGYLLAAVLLLYTTTIVGGVSTVDQYTVDSVTTFDFNGWTNTAEETLIVLDHSSLSNPDAKHNFTWVYGDGNRDEEVTMATFVHNHTYASRGVYEGSVTVFDWDESEFFTLTFTATVGSLQLQQASPFVFKKNADFTMDWTCDNCVGSKYYIDKDNGNGEITVDDKVTYELKYTAKGRFDLAIRYKAKDSADVTKDYTVTLKAFVRDESSVSKASIEIMPFSYSSYLQNEDASFRLTHQYTADPVSCSFDFGDGGNNQVHVLTGGTREVTETHAYTAVDTFTAKGSCWTDSDFWETSTVQVTVESPFTRLEASTTHPTLVLDKNETAELQLLMNADYGIPAILIVKVDWGDGEVEDSLGLVVTVNSGLTKLTGLEHAYDTAGEFEIEVEVREGMTTTKKTLPIFKQYYSEELNVTASIPEKDSIYTEQEFDLILNNLPTFDFGYSIDWGVEGESPTAHEPPDMNVEYAGDPNVTLSYTYLYAGDYTVKVNVFNIGFDYTIPITITVIQGVPIRGWELVLEEEETLIIHESEVKFEILYSGDKTQYANATVECSLTRDAEILAPNTFTVDYPITVELPWIVQYQGIAEFVMALECTLNGSNHTLELNVTILTYTESDYLMEYEEMYAVSGTPETPNTVKTAFTFSLFDIKTPFPHRTTWDYGDGTPSSIFSLFQWTVHHLYEKRGEYSGTVTIETPKGDFTKPFTVYVGLSEMTATPDAGIPGTNITIHVWEVRGNISDFDLQFGDGSSVSGSGLDIFAQTHTYTDAGMYDVVTTVDFDGLTETLTYAVGVFIDNIPNNLELVLDADVIPMPPGLVNMEVSIKPGGLSVKYMTCEINWDDKLDMRMDYFENGLAAGETFSRRRMYIELGEHLIETNCSNRVGSTVATKFCIVKSDCFSDDGIFEERYANPRTPMYIMTSIKVLVISRVDILCEVNKIEFEWDLWRINPTTFEKVEQISIRQPKRDTFKIKKGMLDPNIYILSLNVSMVNDGKSQWLYGITYIKVVGTPIIAEFKGGLLRATGNNTARIDARSKSHDPDLGIRRKGPLSFEWECEEYESSMTLNTLDLLVSQNVPGNDIDCTSITQEVKPGILQFRNLDCGAICVVVDESLDSAIFVILERRRNTVFVGEKFTLRTSKIPYIQEVPRGYAFKVSVSTAAKDAVGSASYVQYTKGAPEVEILCVINCDSQVAVTTDLTMEVQCPYCFVEDFDQATITWTLQEWTTSTSTSEVTNLHTFTEVLDDNHAALVIRKNNLNPCGRYILRVLVSMPSREFPGQSYTNLDVNCPPKDGVCVTEPSSGEARSTNFKTTCSGWVDDGYAGMTGVAPLIFRFYVAQGDLSIPIFQGAQALSPNKTLPVIPGTTGGQYNITVRIFDALADYAEVNNTIELEVTVLRSISELGSGASQAAFTSNLATTVSVLNKQLFETSVSSSIYQTIKVATLNEFISEYASTRAPAQVKESATSTPQVELFEDMWEVFVKQERDSQLKSAIGTKNYDFTNQIITNIGEIETLDGQGLAAVGESLAIIMFSEDTTDFETAEMGSRLVDISADTLEALTNQELYPFGEKVDDAVYGLAAALDRQLNKNSPSYISEDRTLHMKEAGLSDNEAYFFQKRILEKAEEDDTVKKEMSRRSIDTFENSTNKILNVMYKSLVKGQTAKNIGRDGITFTASKSSARSLTNKELDSDDYSFSFPDAFNETMNGTSQLILKASVTKKNPYAWAGDHSSYDITTPILNVALEDDNATSMFSGNISIKLHRPLPEFNVYDVSQTREGEDQFCHHQFQIKKSSDTAYIYVDIGGNLGDVRAYFRNGLPPTTWSENVIHRQGEYVSFNPNRRKKRATDSHSSSLLMFILQPGDIEPGMLYVGLDFKELRTNISSYSFLAYSDSCRVWDRENNVWSNTSCRVSPYSSPYETICDCTDAPGYNFASTFYVPPNLINFNMVFSKFDPTNAAVYGTVLGLFFLFGLAMIWARRKGRADHNRWKIGYLKDNFVGDRYFYLLTVHNGLGGSSGTESRVSFILSGSKADSGVRVLTDGQRHLETGTVMSFVMATDKCLGDLTYLRIWHDNSGEGSKQSWYLCKIYVEDIQKNARFSFICNQWFAMDKDDGLIDRILPVSFTDDIMTFSKLFAEHSRVNISDSHLWVSIFLRPERSMFTRLQRVTCCLLTLLLAMIASAMFYQPEDVDGNSQNTPGNEVRIGTLRFSMTTLFTSSVGIIITLPPILLIVCLFKSRRPWTRKFKGCCCRRQRNTAKDAQMEEQQKNLEYYLKQAGGVQGVVTTNEDPLMSKFEKNPLPPWCLLVAWGLLITGILSCAFAIVLYSMQWGKTTSEEWLASFVLSFVESIFIMDPIKVLFLSALFAICMRKPDGESKSNVPVDEIGEQSQLHGCREIDVSLLPPDPVPKEVLAKARKRRNEENIANGVFVELMLYIFFIFCLFCVSYGNRDGRSFILTEHMRNSLTNMPFRKDPKFYYGTDTEAFTWSRIRVTDDIYTWINETMAPTLLPFSDMRGSPLPWAQRLFTADGTNYRIGPVRIRQVRMPKDEPAPIKENPTFVGPHITHQENLLGTKPRSVAYDIENEETGDFCLNWQPPPCEMENPVTQLAWAYRSSSSEETFPVAGKFHIYTGAAYVVDLIFNRHIVVDMYLTELQDNKWLDTQTRAVFVEFYLYNVNLNLFTSVRLVAEFPEFGGAFTSVDIKPKRLYDLVGPLGAFVLVCQIVMVLTTIGFTVKIVKKLIKLKKRFFSDPWNDLDLTVLVMCYFAVLFYIIRRVLYAIAIERFKDNPRMFVNFDRIILCDDLYGWMLGALVFCCTIRLMRILGYNQRVTAIAEVLKRAGRDLFSFAVIFLIVFTAFAFTGYTLFHVNLKSFMSLWESYNTLLYLILGKNVFKQMEMVSAFISRVYFFILAVAIVMFVMNIFQSILNASASQVRVDVSNVPAPYGVMDVVNKIYKTIVLDNRLMEFIKTRQEMARKAKSKSISKYTSQKDDTTQTQKVLSVLREHFYKSLGNELRFINENSDQSQLNNPNSGQDENGDDAKESNNDMDSKFLQKAGFHLNDPGHGGTQFAGISGQDYGGRNAGTSSQNDQEFRRGSNFRGAFDNVGFEPGDDLRAGLRGHWNPARHPRAPSMSSANPESFNDGFPLGHYEGHPGQNMAEPPVAHSQQQLAPWSFARRDSINNFHNPAIWAPSGGALPSGNPMIPVLESHPDQQTNSTGFSAPKGDDDAAMESNSNGTMPSVFRRANTDDD